MLLRSPHSGGASPSSSCRHSNYSLTLYWFASYLLSAVELVDFSKSFISGVCPSGGPSPQSWSRFNRILMLPVGCCFTLQQKWISVCAPIKWRCSQIRLVAVFMDFKHRNIQHPHPITCRRLPPGSMWLADNSLYTWLRLKQQNWLVCWREMKMWLGKVKVEIQMRLFGLRCNVKL